MEKDKRKRPAKKTLLKRTERKKDSIGRMRMPYIGKISSLLAEPYIPLTPPSIYYLETLIRWLFQDINEQRNNKDFLKHPFISLRKQEVLKGDYVIETKDYLCENDDDVISSWNPIRKDEISDMTVKELLKRPFKCSPSHSKFLLLILNEVRVNLKEFLLMYALKGNIEKGLNEPTYEGEIRIIEILKQRLKEFITHKNVQLIPLTLYHHNNAALIMSEEAGGMEKIEMRLNSSITFEFGFSKKSSDVFTESIINILTKRVLEISTLVDAQPKQMGYPIIPDEIVKIKLSKKAKSKPRKENSKHKSNAQSNSSSRVSINIKQTVKGMVHEKLGEYFSEKDRKSFLKLLNGKKISYKLLFLGDAIKFVNVFYQLHEKKDITTSKVITKKWICTNFKYVYEENPHDFNNEYVRKNLSLQTIISKKSKIKIYDST